MRFKFHRVFLSNRAAKTDGSALGKPTSLGTGLGLTEAAIDPQAHKYVGCIYSTTWVPRDSNWCSFSPLTRMEQCQISSHRVPIPEMGLILWQVLQVSKTFARPIQVDNLLRLSLGLALFAMNTTASFFSRISAEMALWSKCSNTVLVPSNRQAVTKQLSFEKLLERACLVMASFSRNLYIVLLGNGKLMQEFHSACTGQDFNTKTKFSSGKANNNK